MWFWFTTSVFFTDVSRSSILTGGRPPAPAKISELLTLQLVCFFFQGALAQFAGPSFMFESI
jgi:hypothetical protein